MIEGNTLCSQHENSDNVSYSQIIRELLRVCRLRLALFLFGLFISSGLMANQSDYESLRGEMIKSINSGEYALALSRSESFTPASKEQLAKIERLKGIAYHFQRQAEPALKSYLTAEAQQVLEGKELADTLKSVVILSSQLARHRDTVYAGEKYLSLFDNDPLIVQALAFAYFNRTQYRQALEKSNALVRTREANKNVWTVKALSEERLGLNRELIATTAELLQRFGADTVWYSKQAAAYAALGDHQAARDSLNIAQARGLDVPMSSYQALADNATRRQDFSAAIDHWQAGLSRLRRLPSRAEELRLVNYFLNAGRLESALNLVSEINLSSADAKTLKLQVQLAFTLSDWINAIDTAQVGLSYGLKEDPQLWQWLGRSALKVQDYDLAEFAFQQWQELAPDSAAGAWLETLNVLRKKNGG